MPSSSERPRHRPLAPKMTKPAWVVLGDPPGERPRPKDPDHGRGPGGQEDPGQEPAEKPVEKPVKKPVRKCLRCHLHGSVVLRSRHTCPFELCECTKCVKLLVRRRIMNTRRDRERRVAAASAAAGVTTAEPRAAEPPRSSTTADAATEDKAYIVVPVVTLEDSAAMPEYLVTTPAEKKTKQPEDKERQGGTSAPSASTGRAKAKRTLAWAVGSQKGCRHCRLHGLVRFHTRKQGCPFDGCQCRPSCRARSAKLKWLRALKLVRGQLPSTPTAADGTAEDAEGSAEDAAEDAALRPPAPAEASPPQQQPPVLSPERPSVLVINTKATLSKVLPSAERIRALLEEPARPPRPPSVEEIAAPPAPAPPVIDLDLDEPSQAVPCLLCPSCEARFATEEAVQDHVDTVHMQLVPLRILKRLFEMMRLAADERRDQVVEKGLKYSTL